jgi:hypothetical protein
MRKVADAQIKKYTEEPISMEIPYIFNLPYKDLSIFGAALNITSCEEWYLFSFSEEAS